MCIRDRYKDARPFADFHGMLDAVRPDAVFIGVPPEAHAAAQPPNDIELACANRGVHFFLEKPLAASPPEELDDVARAVEQATADGLIVSVGYMFRYSRSIQKMRELIEQAPGGVRAVVARYNCAYSEIVKPEWWDIRRSGGPIVEQATHFCDLARMLGGQVDLATVRGVSIDPASQAAELTDMPTDAEGKPFETPVPVEFRVPRATAAVWRFCNGAVGSLTHAALLHGKKYESELEVWGDGLRMVLDDPYGRCRLLVRRPGSEQTETLDFADDDAYLTEDAAFLHAVRTSDASGIRSTYGDAMKTYRFTWAIRRATHAV